MPVTVRRVTDPADPALAQFGRVQQASYYAPEMLIPPEYFPQLLAGRRTASVGGRQDRILVAEDEGGAVVGGTVYSLLPDAGFNSFMGVSSAARGQGVGRQLQRASLEDVRAAGLAGMFADSVHASRQNAAERRAEERTGTDPVQRRRVLGALGFQVADLPYWQPVGGAGGGPLKDLDLLYCPLQPSSTVPLTLIIGMLRGYWREWLGAERANAEAAALATRSGQSGQSAQIALLPATETPHYWQEGAANSVTV